MLSFSSSSFDAAITATIKDMAPADAAKARAKDGFEEEETAERTAGAKGLFKAQRTGRRMWSRHLSSFSSNRSTNFYHSYILTSKTKHDS